MAFHLEMPLRLAFFPFGAGRKVEARRFVGLAAHVPRAHHRVTVRHGKVQQASGLDVGHVVPFGDLRDELIDRGDRLEHDPTQKGLSESLRTGLRAGVGTFFLHQIQEQRKGPFAVRAAFDAEIPFIGERVGERSFDVLPPTNVPVVHPHQGVVLERVAVVVGQGAFGGSSHMGEDEVGAGLGC